MLVREFIKLLKTILLQRRTSVDCNVQRYREQFFGTVWRYHIDLQVSLGQSFSNQLYTIIMYTKTAANDISRI